MAKPPQRINQDEFPGVPLGQSPMVPKMGAPVTMKNKIPKNRPKMKTNIRVKQKHFQKPVMPPNPNATL